MFILLSLTPKFLIRKLPPHRKIKYFLSIRKWVSNTLCLIGKGFVVSFIEKTKRKLYIGKNKYYIQPEVGNSALISS